MSKKVKVVTYGCQMNVRDAEVVAGLLKQAGYALVDDAAKADVVILNTCSVRQHAEDKVWSEIGRVSKLGRKGHKVSKSQSHKPIIGLIGCMAQNYKEQVFQRCPEVDFVVGPSDIDKIPGILERCTRASPSIKNSRDCPPERKCRGAQDTRSTSRLYEVKIWETDGQIRPDEIYHTGFYEDKDHAYVVISEGCSNFCSYCVVPNVRGPLHNRSHHEILKEITAAVNAGIDSITLLGQNVNAYKSQDTSHPAEAGYPRTPIARGTKSQVDFVDLLHMVNEVTGLTEFSFITSHPRDTSAELFKAMAACEKLKKYLHLPVQSGSDRILKAMNRGYTRKFYLDLIDKYRTIVTGGKLSTDVIVGFSGETHEDFQDTVSLVKQAGFDAAYIFKYSPRPHTLALALPDDVPKIEKEKRHAVVLAMQKEISKKKNAKP